MSNADYIDALTAKINSVDLCADLQDAVDGVMAELQEQADGLVAELEKYAPLLALLTIPINPAEVITWIQNFITTKLTMEIQPYYVMLDQQIALITAIANLTAAIEAKAASIGSCSISI